MGISDDFLTGVDEVMSNFHQKVRLKYYNTSWGAGSYYDDDVSLTKSGNDLWCSGIILPVSNTQGSNDAILLEQGKILTNDTKLYIKGSISTSGIIKIGLGSYTNMSGCEYSLLDVGVTKWKVNDVDIMKKLYVRLLPNGSLLGE